MVEVLTFGATISARCKTLVSKGGKRGSEGKKEKVESEIRYGNAVTSLSGTGLGVQAAYAE